MGRKHFKNKGCNNMSDLSRGAIFFVSGVFAILTGKWINDQLAKRKKSVT